MAPSHLSSVTSLNCNSCTISLACRYLIDSQSIAMRVLKSVVAFRYLYSNQLTGTIPPQLGKLSQLQNLYARNSIVLRDAIYYLRSAFNMYSFETYRCFREGIADRSEDHSFFSSLSLRSIGVSPTTYSPAALAFLLPPRPLQTIGAFSLSSSLGAPYSSKSHELESSSILPVGVGCYRLNSTAACGTTNCSSVGNASFSGYSFHEFC